MIANPIHHNLKAIAYGIIGWNSNYSKEEFQRRAKTDHERNQHDRRPGLTNFMLTALVSVQG